MRTLLLLLGTAALALAPSPARAQEDFYHPELEWKTIETAHFLVIYHEGAERTGRVIAKIAEEIYAPVTSLYGHEPSQKVRFIVKDVDDISNGAAYFYDNKIEIYAPSMDFELRGTHNWLRNVVTHEFTHIVQIQASMKFGRTMPAGFLQLITYESERRQDVLYGYPNAIVSYPISGFVVPAWFAEGVSQYNRKELRYDFWDAHRDMILRSYALDSAMLSWEEMGVFGKTSLGNESSYNAGFAFVSYLADRYGEEKLPEIARNLSRFGTLTIDAAIERAVGKSGSAVYDEWKREITAEYVSRIAPVRAHLRQGKALRFGAEGEVVDPGKIETIETMLAPRTIAAPEKGRALPCCEFRASAGFANLYPSFSPDGTKLAYTSAKGGDYFSLSSLYVYDLTTGVEKLIRPGVRTAVSWSPDGSKIYYGKNTRDNRHWSLQFDLFQYELATERETRLTWSRRAVSPAVSPDGKMLAFVLDADGTSNLAVAAADGSGIRVITPYANGEQVYSPRWSPAGERIVFDFSVRDGREIAWVRPDGTDLEFLIQGEDDSRSAVFTRDGRQLVFSSDRTGIFNLYALDLDSRSVRQLSNVTGGAFLPTVSPAGEIIYAGYTSSGYKLFSLSPESAELSPDASYLRPALPTPPACQPMAGGTASTPQFDWKALRSYDDTQLPALEAKPYRPLFGSLSVMPFLRIDNYNPKATGLELLKPGVYLASAEVIDRTSLLASAAINALGDRDLFAQFQYTGKLPLLYALGVEPVTTLELFNVTRNTTGVINLPASTIPVDVTYDLFEVDVAFGQKVFTQFSDLEFRYAHSRYASVIGSFENPETDPPSLVPGSRDTYLIGNSLMLTFNLNAFVPSTTSEINPVGRKIRVKGGVEFNKFNGDGEYEVTSIGLQPVYKDVNFWKLELLWRENIAMPFRQHTLTARFLGATIFGPPVDEFFNFYAGGLIGMRGYPFYALGGNEAAVLGLGYRFPLVESIDLRIAQLYFDKLYLSLFGDIGSAWSGTAPALRDFRKDLGAELRLEAFSYYSFPTSIFLSGAYGFDRFSSTFIETGQTVQYGKEWAFYFGVLFGFELD